MAQKKAGPSGLLVLDKPKGMTSHDVVSAVRRALDTRRVGHAGTLDPMATGVLVVGVGDATRLLTYVVGADKEYRATIRFGLSTNTDDAEGEVVSRAPDDALARITAGQVLAGIQQLTGDIEQVPSTVSAIRIDGKRAYQRVREGEEVEIPARRVRVSSYDLRRLTVQLCEKGHLHVDAQVRVVCSSGTYVRALARDLGRFLGVGAHLTALRRTRVGGFTLAEATTVAPPPTLESLMSMTAAAERVAPRLDVTSTEARELAMGRGITTPDAPPTAGPFAAVDPSDRFIGLVEFNGRKGRSVMNMPTDWLTTEKAERGSGPGHEKTAGASEDAPTTSIRIDQVRPLTRRERWQR